MLLFSWAAYFLQLFKLCIACVQTITKLWLVPSAKQRRVPCSGPPTDSTNYRKCVSHSPSTWLAITTNKTKPFLTGQSWRVLKSGYTVGSPEQGFRRCFADGVNQSLISSARRLTLQREEKCSLFKFRLRSGSPSECNLNTTFWSAFQNNKLSFEVIILTLWVNKDWDKTLTSQSLPSSSVTVQFPICFTSAVPLIISLTFHLYTNMLVWVDPASSTTPY